MFAKVIIEYQIKSLDKTFTYIVPDKLIDIIKVGMKVLVPFANKKVNGFILSIENSSSSEYQLKEIISILEPELVLSEELLKLGTYMRDTLFCTTISAYQAMLPTSFKIKTQKSNYNNYEKYIVLNKNKEEIQKYINENPKKIKQIAILNKVMEEKRVLKNLISGVPLTNLLKEQLLKEQLEQKYRIINKYQEESKKTLTERQQKIFESVDLNNFNTYLLYGVTGSGKTEVYLNLIEKVINNGKTAIMLVPEISLTMQIVNRFYNRFKNKVAVLHSRLSDGEKHDEYLKIIRKEVSIVVGTRSAVFAPLTNLGIIIIDEEHSSSYKQDNTPKYNAKDLASFRAEYNNIPLILGSATPTLESFARAKKGVFKLLELNTRVGKSILPKVHLVDMEEEYKNKNFVFSTILKEKINEKLENDEQIILLLNRRGFSTFISCSNCGFTYKCPNCDISLTYHKSSNNLICHYCGYQITCHENCPNCNEDGLKYLGLGTEKLEEEITKEFKKAKVIRMDQDTTTKKNSHDKIITAFKNKEYNILLGTSMISKGLDFDNVTLVGVINADTSLNIPDFRSNENTYDLLSQVAGRAGRREKPGEVIIQTFNPDNKVLNFVKDNNYEIFYNYEMDFRKKLRYPPYWYLIGIKVISSDYNLSLEYAKKVANYLKKNSGENTICLGPTTCAILKFKNQYRFQIIIKYKIDQKLMKSLKELNDIFAMKKDVFLDIDVNPSKI